MNKELTGVCRICLGCTRLEQEGFLGVKECKYMPGREKRMWGNYRANKNRYKKKVAHWLPFTS